MAYIGERRRNRMTVQGQLQVPDTVCTPEALRRWLESRGWRRIDPQADPRAYQGERKRNPMSRGSAFPPEHMSVVFTKRGPLLHDPVGGRPLPEARRHTCLFYLTLCPDDTPAAFWDRVLAGATEDFPSVRQAQAGGLLCR